MSTHSFEIEDAVIYGIEKAVLLNNLRFWLDKELANSDRDEQDSGPKIHSHNGKKYVWTYNSSKAFGELFPYMPRRSISRYLLELENDGIIISGIFNKVKYDKTKWYTMPEYSLGQNGKSVGQNGQSEGQYDPSEGQNGQSEDQNGQPIPDIKPNIKPDINTDITEEEFEIDWDAFPKTYRPKPYASNKGIK